MTCAGGGETQLGHAVRPPLVTTLKNRNAATSAARNTTTPIAAARLMSQFTNAVRYVKQVEHLGRRPGAAAGEHEHLVELADRLARPEDDGHDDDRQEHRQHDQAQALDERGAVHGGRLQRRDRAAPACRPRG